MVEMTLYIKMRVTLSREPSPRQSCRERIQTYLLVRCLRRCFRLRRLVLVEWILQPCDTWASSRHLAAQDRQWIESMCSLQIQRFRLQFLLALGIPNELH